MIPALAVARATHLGFLHHQVMHRGLHLLRRWHRGGRRQRCDDRRARKLYRTLSNVTRRPQPVNAAARCRRSSTPRSTTTRPTSTGALRSGGAGLRGVCAARRQSVRRRQSPSCCGLWPRACAARAVGPRGPWRGVAAGRGRGCLRAPGALASLGCRLLPSAVRSHVVLPPDIAKLLPKNRLLSEVRAAPRAGRNGGRATPPGRSDCSTGHSVFDAAPRAGRVARHGRAAVPRLGALRHPPAGAAHHALPVRVKQRTPRPDRGGKPLTRHAQAAAELPAAGGPGGQRRRQQGLIGGTAPREHALPAPALANLRLWCATRRALRSRSRCDGCARCRAA